MSRQGIETLREGASKYPPPPSPHPKSVLIKLFSATYKKKHLCKSEKNVMHNKINKHKEIML